jgi:uncharacterized protein (TIGR04255 family)
MPASVTSQLSSRHTKWRGYSQPPVHEVVLSLTLATPVAVADLESLPSLLRDRFPIAQRQRKVQLNVAIGPQGEQVLNQTQEPDGWRLQNIETTRVVSASRSQLVMHAARPGPWPTGTYDGWEAIYHEARELYELLSGIYRGGQPARAGLRYLNRIAVPQNTQYAEWFTIGFRGPEFLHDEFGINLRQSWARIDGHGSLGATLGLAMIQIPEPSLQVGNVGFLLDIEVFSLPQRSPSIEEMPDWCRRAHDAEGDIFEAAITDQLRQRFEVTR